MQKPTRTYGLVTRDLLVDFSGGYYHRFRSSIGNKTVNEDLPCETLVLEADGRLVARYSGDDKNDASRKERFTAWDEWVKKLPKIEKKNTPAEGGKQTGPGNTGS